MTISAELFGSTPKGLDGGMINPPGGVNFHFHGEVTLNLTVVRPDLVGGDVAMEPVCSDALPETHSGNAPAKEEQWLMRNHPAFHAYMKTLQKELEAAPPTAAIEEEEDEDEPPAEPTDEAEAEEQRGWFARRRAAKVSA